MVLVLDKAFEAAGIAPDPEASDPSAKLRTLLYMLRCAQAHGPADPRWEVRGKYRRTLELDVDGFRISLDLAAFDKQPFTVDQIGGYETWYAIYKMAIAVLMPLRPKDEPPQSAGAR